MGTTPVAALIGPDQDHLQEVVFLVDTGSLYTFVSPETAQRLGIQPTTRTRVATADRRIAEIGVAAGYLRLMDREGSMLIGVMDVPMPLLGVISLEVLGLKVNPVEEVLECARPFGPMAL